MNTQSYPCTLKPNGEACVAIGDFCYDEHKEYLYIVLPNKRGTFDLDSAGRAALFAIGISRDHGQLPPQVWGWDGNVEKPTLTPSIDYRDNWHGYLLGDVLQSC